MQIHHTEFSRNVKFCRDLLQARGNRTIQTIRYLQKKCMPFLVKIREFQTFIFRSVCGRTPRNFTFLLNLPWQIYFWALFFIQFNTETVRLFRKRAIGELKQRHRRRQRERRKTIGFDEHYDTYVVHFGTFLCRSLQNKNMK